MRIEKKTFNSKIHAIKIAEKNLSIWMKNGSRKSRKSYDFRAPMDYTLFLQIIAYSPNCGREWRHFWSSWILINNCYTNCWVKCTDVKTGNNLRICLASYYFETKDNHTKSNQVTAHVGFSDIQFLARNSLLIEFSCLPHIFFLRNALTRTLFGARNYACGWIYRMIKANFVLPKTKSVFSDNVKQTYLQTKP